MQSESPRILAADVVPSGLLVIFQDNGAALFTAEQLAPIRLQAELSLERALLDAAVLQLQEELIESGGDRF